MHHRCFAPRVDRVILLPPAHACLLLRLEMPSERQLVHIRLWVCGAGLLAYSVRFSAGEKGDERWVGCEI